MIGIVGNKSRVSTLLEKKIVKLWLFITTTEKNFVIIPNSILLFVSGIFHLVQECMRFLQLMQLPLYVKGLPGWKSEIG
jgi:uncharacterized membrane protein